MYAIIKTGGKQYRVHEGAEILVEKLSEDIGKNIKITEVLLLKDDKGIHLGDELKGAYVEAEVLGVEKGEKIIVFKYRPKKRYRRKTGHRQQYTRLRITKIVFGKSGKASGKKKEESESHSEAAAS
jgi:large subunit ribosomal protein L21